MPLASSRYDLLKLCLQRCKSNRYFSQTAPCCANPYPFPNNSDPTPYQIFHLLPDASPADVKQRYYDLVKLYHPDSAESRLHEPDPARRHARFSTITRAYARLQKRPAGASEDYEPADNTQAANPWMRTTYARGKAYEEPRYVDDRWKDRLIWGGLIFAFASVAAQSTMVHRRRTKLIEEHVWEPSSASSAGLDSKRLAQSDEDRIRLIQRRR